MAISMMYASAEAGGQMCRHATWRSFPLLLLYHILGASEVCRCKGETNIRFLSSGQHSANDIKDAPHIFSRVDLWSPSALQLGLCPITPEIIRESLGTKTFGKSFAGNFLKESKSNGLIPTLFGIQVVWLGPQMYSPPARASPQSLTLSFSSAFQCGLYCAAYTVPSDTKVTI